MLRKILIFVLAAGLIWSCSKKSSDEATAEAENNAIPDATAQCGSSSCF